MDKLDKTHAGRLDARLKDPLETEEKSQAMAMLELIRPQPDWFAALEVAFTRPPGVPERRAEEDPWDSKTNGERPRRIADELVWLRQAMDEPESNGLTPLPQSAAVAMWDTEEGCMERLSKLRDRRVLDAAGFLLHDGEDLSELL